MGAYDLDLHTNTTRICPLGEVISSITEAQLMHDYDCKYDV